MNRSFFLGILACCILLGGIITTAFAQTPDQLLNSVQNDVEIALSPSSPNANEPVTATLQSSSVNLSSATINWIVAGKSVTKGIGVVSFTATAPAIGKKETVTADISTTDGAFIEKQVVIAPADVDLLWQTNSYTPPFYQGKALLPHQGILQFVAIPNILNSSGIAISPKNFVYTWKKDGDILGDFSGYGKNTLMMRDPIISKPFTMEVDVTNQAGTISGRGTATIQPILPQVLFYENNPLYGIQFNHSLSVFNLSDQEMTADAEPYFFSNDTGEANLEYGWTVNGDNTNNTEQNPRMLTIRQASSTPSGGYGTVALTIDNTLKILQSASNSFTVQFESGKTTENAL